MKKLNNNQRSGGFTMIEMLIVIAIIAILTTMSFSGYRMMAEKAESVKHVSNVRNFTMGTLKYAADNNQTLPSPQYPGGHSPNDPNIPDQWDFAGTGTGLWIDGIIYYTIMFEEHNRRAAENSNYTGQEVTEVDGEDGAHIKDTVFASMQSFRKNPSEEDWHRHSYAMNRSLQYDFLYAKSSDPELTNKNLSRILFRPNALLYIENENSNVIGFEDREDIIDTGKKRWSSKKVIASFLDGSTRTLAANEIPEQEVENDKQSSRFWRGVDADQYTGQ